MKKLGAVQIVSLHYTPSIFIYDQIEHKLIFNRIIKGDEVARVIAEFGKEVTTIKNIRAVSRQAGTLKTREEWDHIVDLEQDLIHLYNNCHEFKDKIENGSGQVTYRNTTIKFRKPKVVEFDDVKK